MKDKMKKVKESGAVIFIALLAAGFFVYTVVDIVNSFNPVRLSVGDSLKAGRYIEADAYYSSSAVLRVKHTINFIPAGTEYYYIAVLESGDSVLVRAPKNWKYAGTELDTYTSDMFRISGKVRKLDYDNVRQLADMGIAAEMDVTYYIDTISKKNSYMVAIFEVIFILALVMMIQIGKGYLFADMKQEIKPKVELLIVALIFISAVLLLHYMTMMFG